MKYNIKDAGTDYLIFGEQASSSLGNYTWLKEFKRDS
jgi:hypothetical protein